MQNENIMMKRSPMPNSKMSKTPNVENAGNKISTMFVTA